MDFYNKIVTGCDNGVSGQIGVIYPSNLPAVLFPTPIRSCLNYTKKKAFINRVDVVALEKLLVDNVIEQLQSGQGIYAAIERPLVNPMRFQATTSALRAYEATLIVLERLSIPYGTIDSKEWQKMLLPSGLKGSAEQKLASAEVGRRLFPHLNIKKDADGILIAEYVRRKQL